MADATHVTYEVTNQEKRSEPDGTGGYHDVFHIHYTSPSGTKSHVKVPATHYTPANVHAQIQHEMDRIEAVNALQPGMPAPPVE